MQEQIEKLREDVLEGVGDMGALSDTEKRGLWLAVLTTAILIGLLLLTPVIVRETNAYFRAKRTEYKE